MEVSYTEFDWKSSDPGNGDSGKGLADRVILVVSAVAAGSRVCDLGCGNGYLAGRLAEVGYDVVGIDASSSGVAIARQTCPTTATFVREVINSGIAERTGLKDLDMVITSDVIEHLYRPADLIEAAASLLKPAGYIVVTTPYHGYLKNVALSISGKMDWHFANAPTISPKKPPFSMNRHEPPS